jgi:hypothetical protein
MKITQSYLNNDCPDPRYIEVTQVVSMEIASGILCCGLLAGIQENQTLTRQRHPEGAWQISSD